jgi:deoxyribonuclease V
MDYKELHSWDVSPKEAMEIQNKFRSEVKIQKLTSPVRYVAGADISFEKFSDKVYAGFVVLDIKTLEVVASSAVITETKFPYIPGLFSFRETPPLLEAWKKLDFEPDVVVLDGQGIAHPRRFGLASHIGILIDKPTIGCAKTILVGKYWNLDNTAGSTASIKDKGEEVGIALRTKNKVEPVYISVGHLIDLEDSIKVIMDTVSGYRIPLPTRQAHILVNDLRTKDGKKTREDKEDERKREKRTDKRREKRELEKEWNEEVE